MAKEDTEITPEAFDRLVEQVGLTLDAEERARMLDGYRGLQRLLARLPDDPDMADEPAVVYLGSGSRVVR